MTIAKSEPNTAGFNMSKTENCSNLNKFIYSFREVSFQVLNVLFLQLRIYYTNQKVKLKKGFRTLKKAGVRKVQKLPMNGQNVFASSERDSDL